MLREQWIELGDQTAWDRALEGIPHGYWHSRQACQVASINTGSPVHLYVASVHDVRIVCPLMTRQWRGHIDLTTPIGLSGFASSSGTYPSCFPELWCSSLRARGVVCAYLAQHALYAPMWPREPEQNGSTLFVLDLDCSPQDWLQRVDANRRRSILQWERDGRDWVRDRAALTEFAVQHHADFMRSVGASAASYISADALRLQCSDEAVELVGIADADGLCTVAGFGSTPFGSELLFHISIRKGRHYTAALVWWAVLHYHGKVPLVNLGGTPKENDSLADAKRRYRPREMPFRKLKLVADPARYGALCSDAGVAADIVSDYFPPYRRPRAI